MNNNIKILRTDRGWSQEQFANSIGVSRQTVISIEKGKYCPSLPLAFKIARAFGLKIEDVFDDEKPYSE